MPLGRLKVGSVASDRTGLLIADPRLEKRSRPAWVENERITSLVKITPPKPRGSHRDSLHR